MDMESILSIIPRLQLQGNLRHKALVTLKRE
jgi:hypothetical protein